MLISGDIDRHIGPPALGVGHLAQDPAVGGENALDGLHGAVGVGQHVHGGPTLQVHVLGAHLAVGDQVRDDALRSHKAALAVGHRDGVEIPRVAEQHPGGLYGGHPGGDVPALVPPDEVIGEGGAVPVHRG